MNTLKYLEDPKVVKEINALKQYLRTNPLYVSDIIDDAGNQYVDLVQEGGGVLGIAFIGFAYAMEEAGIRFFSLAGTSAGAINTAFLAAAGNPHERKAEKILDIVDKTNLLDFIDGGKDAKRWAKVFSKGKKLSAVLSSLGFLMIFLLERN